MLYNLYSMHRTQIYLSDHQYEELTRLRRSQRSTLAEIVRKAVDRYIEDAHGCDPLSVLETTFGAWQRDGQPDSLDEVIRMRQQWNARESRWTS